MEAESREASPPKKHRSILKQFNWRMILVRVLINSLTLILVALLVPKIYFVDKTLLSVFLVAVGLGILNALVKPAIQFLTLQFIFATLGFVVILINTIMLLLLSILFDKRFAVDGIIWAIVGGALMGLISSLLESLLGLNVPIVLDASGQNELPVARPSPVESLFLKSLAEEEAPEDEAAMPAAGAAVAEAPAADESTPPLTAETVVEVTEAGVESQAEMSESTAATEPAAESTAEADAESTELSPEDER